MPHYILKYKRLKNKKNKNSQKSAKKLKLNHKRQIH